MADKTLFTRIKLKYDLYTNWKTKNPVLLKGEAAVCEVPVSDPKVATNEPCILMKLGDGEKNFNDLPFLSGLSADVYSWAKAETKPGYTADEITGLADYIADEIQDTNTTYRFSYANDTLLVESKEKTSEEWVKAAELPITVSTKVDKDTDAVAGNIAQFVAGGNIEDSGEKIGDYLKKTDAANTYATQDDLGGLEETVSGINERVGTAEGEIDTLQGQVSTLIGSDASKSVRAIANEELAAQLIPSNAKDSLDTLQEVAAWIQNHPSDASAMNTAITNLQTQVGTAGANATGIEKKIADNAAAIATLEESSHPHSNKGVLDGITAAKVTAWDAAESNAKGYTDTRETAILNTINPQIEGLDGRVGTLESDNTTNKSNIKANSDAIAALEEDSHTHGNKDVIDGITSDKVTTWDAAVQSVAGVTATKSGTTVTVTGVSTDLMTQGSKTLIFDCGDSNI